MVFFLVYVTKIHRNIQNKITTQIAKEEVTHSSPTRNLSIDTRALQSVGAPKRVLLMLTQHRVELLPTFSSHNYLSAGWPLASSQFVVEAVEVVQVIAVVGGLRAYKHVMVVQDFQERQQIIVVIICCGEEVIHLVLCYVPGRKGDQPCESMKVNHSLELLSHSSENFSLYVDT